MKANLYKKIGMKIKSRCFCVLIFLLFFSSLAFAVDYIHVNTDALDQNFSKKVLILNSYHQGHPWTDKVTKGILDEFAKHDIGVEIHIENLDTKRIKDRDSWNYILKEKLKSYSEGYLDLAIVSDDNALYSLYQIGHSYHKFPVVYCGVTKDIERHVDTCDMFIAVEEYLPFKENIELGRKLFPKTEHIAIVTDHSRTGASHYLAAKRTVKNMDLQGVDIIWLNGYANLSTEQLEEQLSTLPENTFVIFSIWQVDKRGRFWEPNKYYQKLADITNAPILTVTDLGISNAFLGGMVTVAEKQGKLAADLGIQLLYGELLEDIKRVSDENEYIFNWQEMNRWNIKASQLPEGSKIINKPLTVYSEYRTFFFLTITLIILMFVLFWLLLLYHFRYRNYEIQRTKMAAETKIMANRYNILFEQSNSAIVIFDLESSNVITFNDKALTLFEVPEERFKNYPLNVYFHNYNELKANLDHLLKEPFEMTMFKNDKSTFAAHVILSLLKEDDNTTYAYAIINDISLRKEQEEEIKIGKERLNEALLNSKNSYWEWDLVNNILFKDDSFWRALDIDPKSLEEDPVDSNYYLNSIHPDDQNKFIDQVNDAILGKKDTIFSELRMSISGKVIWVEVRGVISKRDENGKGLAINGFMMNINKRKHQEAELIEAKEKAEESDKLKSAFISNISHEIRTPLNGIVGFSNLLGRENLNLEDKRKYLSFINENNDLLLKLINDILEISRIETDSLSIQEESINLGTLCENIIAQESIHLTPTVNLEMDEIQSVNVQIDKLRLTQVLKNLLSNAIKFTEEGSIKMGYTIKRDLIEFYIRDTGIGISEDMHEKIFERFVQVDPFSSGTGLGLSISKALIEKMGGKIWVESSLGGGSAFYFTTKFKKAKIEIDDIEPTAIKDKKNDDKAEEGSHTVLIVENDESSFVLLNVILKGKYKIIRVLTTKDIMMYLDRYEPSVMIANTDMPGFSSVLVSDLRKSYNNLPIIGISENTLVQSRNKEMSDILDGHLIKPINLRSLMDILDEKLEK